MPIGTGGLTELFTEGLLFDGAFPVAFDLFKIGLLTRDFLLPFATFPGAGDLTDSGVFGIGGIEGGTFSVVAGTDGTEGI